MKTTRSFLQGKNVLITGGTGSLGKVLTKRLLQYAVNNIRIFSRDEAKQYFMSKRFSDSRLKFQIGDIRNLNDVVQALQDIDIVFNTAALKQVPNCEYAPWQAVQTNVLGAENVVTAISNFHIPVQVVVGISTDKAAKPVNTMGMSKAIQERVFIHANLRCADTRFVCTRYGNVLASRGSLIPLFHQLISENKPLGVTSSKMTRFLMNLEEAADLILYAMTNALPGETVIPKVYSGYIIDIAKLFEERSNSKVLITGLRPGEKNHEILIGEEEASRTIIENDKFIIQPMLEELQKRTGAILYTESEFSSADRLIDINTLRDRLFAEELLPGQCTLEKFNI